MTTYNQNTAMPTRKVQGAAIGGAFATVLAAAMAASGYEPLIKFIGYPGIEAAMGGLFATALAYWLKERV